jgi:hypothetical protein
LLARQIESLHNRIKHRVARRTELQADVEAPSLTMYGVIVTRKVGPFDLRREYAAPDS